MNVLKDCNSLVTAPNTTNSLIVPTILQMPPTFVRCRWIVHVLWYTQPNWIMSSRIVFLVSLYISQTLCNPPERHTDSLSIFSQFGRNENVTFHSHHHSTKWKQSGTWAHKKKPKQWYIPNWWQIRRSHLDVIQEIRVHARTHTHALTHKQARARAYFMLKLFWCFFCVCVRKQTI